MAWTVASLVPATFLVLLFALTFFAAPVHDDFCIATQFAHTGLVATVISLYSELSGRVVPFMLLQIPAAISFATGANVVFAYSLTIAAGAILSLAGMGFAIARTRPPIAGPHLVFVVLAFAAAVAGASPSIRDLLYWLPAVACYMPSALASILVLAECVRALDRESEFSPAATWSMATVGFIGALCNEFTGVWLILIILGSLSARLVFGQKLQADRHALIAAAILIGWIVVVLAKGNSIRMGSLDGSGDLARSLHEGLRFSLTGLGRFFRDPAIIGWFAAVAALTLTEPEPVRPVHARGWQLALGVTVVCLACCYFEYFTHEFSTGGPLVERAQNQALIFLLFGLTLSLSLLLRAYRPKFRWPPALRGGAGASASTTLPVLLTAVMAVSLYLSPTASLIRLEGSELYPYWQESVARDRLLSTSHEEIVVVPKHRSKPTILMTADVSVATRCVASYYGKTQVIPVDPDP
jgi:hypothetical protein